MSQEFESINFLQLNLHERLLKAIEKASFSICTPIQQKAIPELLLKKDLMLEAETGSGKTAAFLLPVLHNLLVNKVTHYGSRVLILAPTRELAAQLLKQVQQLALFTRIEAGLICGGEDFKYQKALLRKNPEVLIATPGRLLEHIQLETPTLDNLEVLILDEADRMLDMGLSQDVLEIVKQCNKTRQSILVSATLNHKGIAAIAAKILHKAEIITTQSMRDQHQNIKQKIILADHDDHKEKLLIHLLKNTSYQKALVFTNTRNKAVKLLSRVRANKMLVHVLHGELEHEQRKQVMHSFKKGNNNILLATDLAARGLDIAEIDLVINFDMAGSATEYIHRIGRTGRAENQGMAYSLIKPNEWNLKASIERYLNYKFELAVISSLKGDFQGPQKLKKSGKMASSTKKNKDKQKQKAGTVKVRVRDKKDIGKRRKPTGHNRKLMTTSGGQGVVKKKTGVNEELDINKAEDL